MRQWLAVFVDHSSDEVAVEDVPIPTLEHLCVVARAERPGGICEDVHATATGVARNEPVRPVGGRGGEDCPPAGHAVDTHAAVFVLVRLPQIVGGFVPTDISLSPARRCRREDGEILRRPVSTSRDGPTIDYRELAAVALVPDDGVSPPKLHPLQQSGPLEDPVVRTVHLVGARAVWNAVPEAVETAAEKAHARQLVLRALYEMVAP